MKNDTVISTDITTESAERIGCLVHRGIMTLLLVGLLCRLVSPAAHALQGATSVHDPSTITKVNGVYHIFGTGNGISHITSTDLVNWAVAPAVFPSGWPSWINNYVPGFVGAFWAPDVRYMNGQYYLYYACSTFGSQISAIGLATSPDLSTWTDQGVVVSSNGSSPYNAIDPAIFQDANNKLWLVFGSHWRGIYMVQLNATTGKPLNSTFYHLASNNEAEAPYVVQHGNYYYLFYNAGVCCEGVNSTYHVMMGRSANPLGPYLDRNGTPLTSGGGTLFLGTFGRYIGPGCVGVFSENGVDYISYHYYDGDANGLPILNIRDLLWDTSDWPYVSDWVTNGTYTIRSQGNGLVWDGGAGGSLQPLVQNLYNGQPAQQWGITQLSTGDYTITCGRGGLVADVFNNSPAAGSKLDLYPYQGEGGQQWDIDRVNDGGLVISSVNGNRVVDIPDGTATPGAQLQIWDYNGFPTQKWLITPPLSIITALSPAGAVAGSPSFTLTITGTNFTASSTILWNGTALPTTFVSATQLTATVPASDAATPGVIPVTVVGASAPAAFTVIGPIIRLAISNVAVGPIGLNSATLTWTTNYPAGATVTYGPTSASGSAATGAAGVTSHSVVLTGLKPGTTYYYGVTSQGLVGGSTLTAADPGGSFTTASMTGVRLSVTQTGTTYDSSTKRELVTVRVSNTGTAAAQNVQFKFALMGSTPCLDALPMALGTIAAGASKTITLHFPASASGGLSWGGLFSGGSFSSVNGLNSPN